MEARPRHRVVVTGMGVKSPAGLDVESFGRTILEGRSMAGPIQAFEAEDHPVRIACEVKGFDPAELMGAKEARRADRVAQLGVAAADDAWRQAGSPDVEPARAGVVMGTGVGGLTTLEGQVRLANDRGYDRVSPMLVPQMMANATSALVGMRFGLAGPNLCVATACAAGAHAIGEAARLIAVGAADVVIAGGAEAAITPVALAAFARMGALSSNPDAGSASRPFDADRDGFVMGEGAAALVLESEEHASARSAPILGEVLGYALTCDAHHITAPSPTGAGAVMAMRLALADAGVEPAAVTHVNAHGTSTPLNDAVEAGAIGEVFGAHSVPVTSTKGVTGHLVGAAGAVEAVAALLAATSGAVPPTANHCRTDRALAVDVVSERPRQVGPGPVLSNSFGFGGHNAALVLGPAPAG